jgi:hypothetical protein
VLLPSVVEKICRVLTLPSFVEVHSFLTRRVYVYLCVLVAVGGTILTDFDHGEEGNSLRSLTHNRASCYLVCVAAQCLGWFKKMISAYVIACDSL